ncbi:VOC family protein [Bradyrhizobium ontarionense]|uniref:Bleomycin resistance protein n=1 Tax=Bradyrhizobium ontarionense TaxID=2898149 RepID=A0ABY3R8K3_9BRAD|nr:VOC family protein [Bradyrhizobium sp. A19]UFZ03357.1 VOC family protein [Bradyrhizobium sp. A19]
MTVSSDRLPTGGFAPLVPELDVSDLGASKSFWCDLLGFRIAYQRPEDRFMYIELQGAQVMLMQHNGNWETGPLERPFGRGINFQIVVDDVDPMLAALAQANWPLFEKCREAWYRVGERARGQRQFLVQDPDGYLLRFAQDLGLR